MIKTDIQFYENEQASPGKRSRDVAHSECVVCDITHEG